MSLNRDIGALALPLLDTGARDLSRLDPARDIMLELFTAAIRAELAPAWEDAVAGTKLARADDAIAARHPFSPVPNHLWQLETKFPALYVYRSDRTRDEYRTLWQRQYRGRWGVDYFLGPLDIGTLGKLQDVLIAVGKIVGEVVHFGGHSSFASGVNVLGERGFGRCGFSSATLIDFNAGGARFANEESAPSYIACSSVIETTELVLPRLVNPVELEGASFDVATPDGTGIVVEAQSESFDPDAEP